MSNSRSDRSGSGGADRSSGDPLRPADHADSADPGAASGGSDGTVVQPRLGGVGWLRWIWRQLTSMRTALLLLLLLAVAAIPGSLVPQRSADPNGVTQYYRDHPELAPVLDAIQMFDVYTSAWFSAIYLLLFVSLIGCVIPRTQHHAKALAARPPRTPARLSRLAAYQRRQTPVEGGDAEAAASGAIERAAAQLRRAGYRVQRYDGRGSWSVSAERGYIRETGNLVFHAALVGVLIAVGVGGGFAYTGQRVVVEGTTFVNVFTDYSSFTGGRFVDGTELEPYAMTLDEFQVEYEAPDSTAPGQAGDFAAQVTTRIPGQGSGEGAIRVNHPLRIEGDSIYLLGNGYAPTITVRNADGDVVYSDSQPFLPQDSNMTSLGIIKVPDGMPEQLGLVGFLYPTQSTLESGAYTSIYPDLINPIVTFNVFAGDLGIDDGTPRSVYALDTEGMEQLTGGDTAGDSIELAPGQTADLPDGLGTVTFENEAATAEDDTVKRFASLQVHRDDSAGWVLVFAVLAVLGLLTALFVPRRRVWVKAQVDADGAEPTVVLEYAGLARGEDPTLDAAVSQIADRHAGEPDPGR
ncbi:cytochrome c biogenesis protein ResB [Microbacterium sp. LRZ72]|uniref:cytochrome c biogenesis protein ResB n=1 Tax=Microbacterium sp. LRZ72 TaxID=2942481 RepID=UPI0029A0338D|nr:cytochrome c biogenesis protein ResB [Microbacterium sp. LRZ72]MDX2376022.1 cytochrome c biogenesis protein ResB [Microbacterium sp. LRZ72]